jgi:hypothetical protein
MLVGAFLSAFGVSAASACNRSAYCAYLGTGANPNGDHGGETFLCKTKLYVYDPTQAFVSRELWVYYDYPQDFKY